MLSFSSSLLHSGPIRYFQATLLVSLRAKAGPPCCFGTVSATVSASAVRKACIAHAMPAKNDYYVHVHLANFADAARMQL